MSEPTIEQTFNQIQAWLAEHAPSLNKHFNPAAKPVQIAKLETKIGCVLPDSVRAAYLLHNGESSDSHGLYGTWRWLPLDEVLAIDAEQRLIEAEYQFGDFTPGLMIPVMQSGGGDLYYVESCGHPDAAQPAGNESEVLEWWHEQPTRNVIAPSFAGLWQQFYLDLQAGKYVYKPDYLEAMIDVDELD